MANVTIMKNKFIQAIAPDSTQYISLGPMDVFRTGGAITVTAIPRSGAPDTKMYMEVIQTAVRQEVVTFGAPNFFLDIVVRNNSHQSDPEATTIEAFDVFTSVVTE